MKRVRLIKQKTRQQLPHTFLQLQMHHLFNRIFSIQILTAIQKAKEMLYNNGINI